MRYWEESPDILAFSGFQPGWLGSAGTGCTVTIEQQADLGQQALRSFDQDLPRLWEERRGQWVAYQGERLLGFAKQKHELYHQCFARGLTREDFLIFCIEPIVTEMIFGIDTSG
jgi:hypothetical protein